MLRMRKLTIGVIVMGAVGITVGGCSDSDGLSVIGASTTIPGQGDHTEHTDVAEGLWPPQPTGMTNVQAVPASARNGVLSGVIDAARSAVLNNPDVNEALGSSYREFEGSLGDEKGTTTASFVFYNYTDNQTVEVFLKNDGRIEQESFAATVYQPTEHPDEVEMAIKLAGDWLVAAGFETSGLTGTAMLAFPRRQALVDIAHQFYPQRMMYVTFGPGNGELPVYSALVNLGSMEVSESGVIN